MGNIILDLMNIEQFSLGCTCIGTPFYGSIRVSIWTCIKYCYFEDFGGIFISLHHEPPNNNSLYTALGESVYILTDGQFQQS